MIRFTFRNQVVEMLNDIAPSTNLHQHRHEHRLDDEDGYAPYSCHTVRILSGSDELASCVLSANGGATGIHEHSALVHDDSLIIAVGPFIASLRLPTLELNWKVQADDATCFGVYHSVTHRCYLSHGELSIAHVSYEGKVVWSNSGADIFTNGFALADDAVKAVDWDNRVYIWRIQTGEVLSVSQSPREFP